MAAGTGIVSTRDIGTERLILLHFIEQVQNIVKSEQEQKKRPKAEQWISIHNHYHSLLKHEALLLLSVYLLLFLLLCSVKLPFEPPLVGLQLLDLRLVLGVAFRHGARNILHAIC